MSDHEHEREYEVEEVPLSIFTGGLDFDQERDLEAIKEAMERGSAYLRAMAAGNQDVIDEFEALHRFLHGIAIAAVLPIVKMITEGVNPGAAMAAVIGGVGGMFFFGGIEYAKLMGLDGVGVDLPVTEKSNDDPSPYHPEEMPNTNASLDDLLKQFTLTNPDLGEEE